MGGIIRTNTIHTIRTTEIESEDKLIEGFHPVVPSRYR